MSSCSSTTAAAEVLVRPLLVGPSASARAGSSSGAEQSRTRRTGELAEAGVAISAGQPRS